MKLAMLKMAWAFMPKRFQGMCFTFLLVICITIWQKFIIFIANDIFILELVLGLFTLYGIFKISMYSYSWVLEK